MYRALPAKATLEPPTVAATADALGRLNDNVSLKGAHAIAPDHGPPLIRREGGTTIILPVQDPTRALQNSSQPPVSVSSRHPSQNRHSFWQNIVK